MAVSEKYQMFSIEDHVPADPRPSARPGLENRRRLARRSHNPEHKEA